MARVGRAYWKGFLRLSLVSIGVELYNAVDPGSSLTLNQIHKPTGRRIRYTKTVEGVGEVDSADIVKGYQIESNHYVVLEPEELEAIKLESKKTVDLVQFVKREDVPVGFFERPYYLVPADDHATEGYLVIREALAKSGKLGMGQITLSGREHLALVGPVDKGLGLEIIRYADELRPARAYFDDLPEMKLDPEMIRLASELIERKSGPFTPEQFSDRYATALQDLVARKAKGQTIAVPERSEKPSNVVNLMEALRKSVSSDARKPTARPAASGRASPPASSKKRAGGRK
jgi:DNA end-binding protein Ku